MTKMPDINLLKNYGYWLNGHIIIMIISASFSQYILAVSPSITETIKPHFNITAYLTFMTSMLLYLAFFSRTFNKSIIKTSTNKNSTDIIYKIFLVFVLVYWVPLFIVVGVSDIDRAAWRNANSQYGTQYAQYVLLPFAISAAIQTQRIQRKFFILFLYLCILIGTGERFTGLIIALPIIGLFQKIRQTPLLMITIIIGAAAYKIFSTYYDGNINLRFLIELVTVRVSKEAGLINTVFNLGDMGLFYQKPSILLPYQSWGTTDKMLVMSHAMTASSYTSFAQTGGLITGTFVSTAVYYFHIIPTIILSIFLGVIGGKISSTAIILILNKRNITALAGLLLLCIFYMRFLPIIHSGMLTSIFKLDFLIYTLFIFAAVYHSRKINSND